MIAISATLDDIYGNALPVSFAGLRVQLCGYGSQVPRVAGTALLAQTSPTELLCSVAGLVITNIFGNDVILPVGTYYTVQAIDTNGNVIQTNAYEFTGAGPIDLSTAPLYAPDPAPAPPAIPTAPPVGSLVVINSSPTPVLLPVGASVVTYDLTLTSNAVATMPAPVPSQIVIMIVRQNGVGGWTLTYPPNFQDPSQPNPTPGSASAQAYVTDAYGNLNPFSLSTSNQPATPVTPPPSGNVTIGSLVIVASSATPVFTPVNLAVVTYDLTLTSNAVATMPEPLPSQIVILIVRQDAVGGHTLGYPPNFQDPSAPSPTPGSVSAQAYVTDTFGNLNPFGLSID